MTPILELQSLPLATPPRYMNSEFSLFTFLGKNQELSDSDRRQNDKSYNLASEGFSAGAENCEKILAGVLYDV
ncbi:hypothetical protein llap_3440 [Limosa lapponica baueri]|uniref:Uncharacterized protein n=1 Tax=Limosa lapponica baueri TaxID=1758121 RepID=A0A2I0UJP6_LIMLA|nr:hypothetical protein llap_3440 [Limosa lapponica baueri]